MNKRQYKKKMKKQGKVDILDKYHVRVISYTEILNMLDEFNKKKIGD